MAKVNSYISLVRATEDEIKEEFGEIIEGQIIFDTTNKTISCDEQGKRIVYVGNALSKSAIGEELSASFDSSNETYTLLKDYAIGEYFTIDGELYTVTSGGMTKGRTFTKANFKTQTVPTRRINLCDELETLSVLMGKLNNNLTEINGDLDNKVSNFTSDNYKPVTGLSYNATTKKLGLKVEGADAVIPFSSGAKLVGTYTNHTTVDVSNLGATSASQFVLVPYIDTHNSGFRRWATGGNWTLSLSFYPPSISYSNGKVSITLPRCGASSNSGNTEEGLMNVGLTIPCRLYYIGDVN